MATASAAVAAASRRRPCEGVADLRAPGGVEQVAIGVDGALRGHEQPLGISTRASTRRARMSSCAVEALLQHAGDLLVRQPVMA